MPISLCLAPSKHDAEDRRQPTAEPIATGNLHGSTHASQFRPSTQFAFLSSSQTFSATPLSPLCRGRGSSTTEFDPPGHPVDPAIRIKIPPPRGVSTVPGASSLRDPSPTLPLPHMNLLRLRVTPLIGCSLPLEDGVSDVLTPTDPAERDLNWACRAGEDCDVDEPREEGEAWNGCGARGALRSGVSR